MCEILPEWRFTCFAATRLSYPLGLRTIAAPFGKEGPDLEPRDDIVHLIGYEEEKGGGAQIPIGIRQAARWVFAVPTSHILGL